MIYEELELNVLFNILTNSDFLDINFLESIIKRIINNGNLKYFEQFFMKLNHVFIFSNDAYRNDCFSIINSYITKFRLYEEEDIFKSTIVGNLLYLYWFISNYNIITNDIFEKYSYLNNLIYLDDINLDFIPKGKKIVLGINENINDKQYKKYLDNAINISEKLFHKQIIIASKDSINSLLTLYSASNQPEYIYKKQIIESLLNKDIDKFIVLINNIYDENIKNEDEIKNKYNEIYFNLRKVSIPVYFSINNIKTNGVLSNENFYFAILLNNKGDTNLLFPFETTKIDSVLKIYDLKSKQFLTPKNRFGRIKISDIYSFRKINLEKKITPEQIKSIKNLYEDNIEIKIRSILKDINKTPHGPTEILDIIPLNLRINNEDDIRMAGFILKGKGYPKINLTEISNNLIKAVTSPVKLIVLIYTGELGDGALIAFEELSNMSNKMYTIIDPIKLAQIFLAYNIDF